MFDRNKMLSPSVIGLTVLIWICCKTSIEAAAFVTPLAYDIQSSGCVSNTNVARRNNKVMRFSSDKIDVDSSILEAQTILIRAAETKKEESEVVYEALSNLEKLMRQKAKMDPNTATKMKNALDGDWRLIFTTGTKSTQEKYGKVNYFPLKAVQSFRTKSKPPMTISNGIFVGNFQLVQFFGTMDFDLDKRKLEFDFDEIEILGLFKLALGKGDAAKIGASSGLGSENNVENAKRGKRAFFNWISASDEIATARGGGGGLALWKRMQ